MKTERIFMLLAVLLSTASLSCASRLKGESQNHPDFLSSIQSFTESQKKSSTNKNELKTFLLKTYGADWASVATNYLACGFKLPSSDLDAVVYFNTGVITPTDFNNSAKYRLIETHRIYKKYRPQKVILSGNNHKGASKTAAKKYIESIGVPVNDIMLESQSNTTWSNIENTVKILKKKRLKKVHLVASAYHMERILRYYEKQFPKNEPGLELSWSYYQPYLDEAQQRENLVLHEVYSIPRDHLKYGNKFKSQNCEANKRSR